MAVNKKRKVIKKKKKSHVHKWSYFGGVCKCTVKGCKKYLQPGGKITTKP